jgi:hypothetical protein
LDHTGAWIFSMFHRLPSSQNGSFAAPCLNDVADVVGDAASTPGIARKAAIAASTDWPCGSFVIDAAAQPAQARRRSRAQHVVALVRIDRR